MRRTLTATALSTALLVAGAPLATSATASGGNDDRVIRTGSCSGSADWKLKAKTDDGRLEVEWEVDSNQAGQTWRVRVRDNRRSDYLGGHLNARSDDVYQYDLVLNSSHLGEELCAELIVHAVRARKAARADSRGGP